MPKHDAAARRNNAAASPRGTGATPGRITRLSLSIGGGVLSFAAMQAPALAGPCGTGVVVESPDQTTLIESNGVVDCIILPGGDAAITLNGQVTPLVPLSDPVNITTYSYDSGELPVLTDSQGVTTTTYDYDADPILLQQPGGVTTYTYDYGSGEPVLTETNTPSVTTTTYDYDGGRLSAVEQPGNTTTYTYDALDRTVTADTSGNVTTYVYDSLNEITNVDGTGGVTTYSYDAGQLSQIESPSRTVTTYDYVAGALSSSSDPLGNTTTYVYDAMNRLTTDSGNSDGATNFAYASSVPEPSSLALLLSGLAGWVGLRRRRH